MILSVTGHRIVHSVTMKNDAVRISFIIGCRKEEGVLQLGRSPSSPQKIQGGGRKRLPKFKFSVKFPIGLHVILQIQIKKFENDCYIM